MNYEQAEQKLYDLDCNGQLEPLLESDDLVNTLWALFPEAFAIQEYHSFIRELCEEQVLENYGYMNYDAVNELIKPMMDWYYPVSVTKSIDLIFSRH